MLSSATPTPGGGWVLLLLMTQYASPRILWPPAGGATTGSRRSTRPWAWHVCLFLVVFSSVQNTVGSTPASLEYSASSAVLAPSLDAPPPPAPPVVGVEVGPAPSPTRGYVRMIDVQVYKGVMAIAILVFWAAFWVIHIVSILYGYRKLHRRRTPADGGGVESGVGVLGVSVLKPLVGTPMDPNLMTNLESFFTMNYPKYELVFCVHEDGDPSIMIVKQLMKKHPDVDASLHIGGKLVGVNPKINNMQPGYLAAKHELVLVSDSSLVMKEDTLADMVDHMTHDVGIVHQMPFTADRKGWPAVLEKVYFGTGHSRMYLFLGLLDAMGLGVNCCTGMSCLMRKKVLDEAGGISAFGIYLAEDYFFAKYIQDRGWGIRISSQPACQNAGICRVKGFLSRLTRWCKLRIAMVPHTLILEPLSECMVLGLLASWAGVTLLHADYLTFFLFHTLTWAVGDWIMLNIVQNGPPPFTKFEFVISWLFREVSALFLFLHALWNPVISWRTGSYKLRWWGVAEPVNTRVAIM